MALSKSTKLAFDASPCEHITVSTCPVLALICLQLVVFIEGSSANVRPNQGPRIVFQPSLTEHVSVPATNKSRIALVIGNSEYRKVTTLKNPVNDAEDMAAILRTDFGFEVDQTLDADHKQMEKAIEKFVSKLSPKTVGLFYYAGHGVQIDGENYFIPVDSAPKSKDDVKHTAYSASRLSERMEATEAKLNIIILDACRDNPFREERLLRPETRGLAIMQAGKGSFIAFATGPNQIAYDNSLERNGLFTKHLLQALRERPSCLYDVFDKAREAVYQESILKKKIQIPWVATNIIGRFCFSEPDPPTLPALAPCKGKVVPGSAQSFSVDKNYTPSGILGDIDDVQIIPQPESCIFEYTTRGQGSHEWDYKYKQNELNTQPAQFGGVFYLNPPNNFGTVCGGFDLRQFRRAIKWEVRSVSGETMVEFIIGGIKWVWDERNKTQTTPLYPDSMERFSLGTKKLTTKWQTFEVSLSDIPDSDFMRVVNAFAWVIHWSSNGVRLNKDRTGSEQSRTFKIEIRKISYER